MQEAKPLVLSLALFGAGLAAVACASDAPGASRRESAAAVQAAPKRATTTVVYYFHGTNRCRTCRTIEAYADEAVKNAFGPALSNGQLIWKPTNIDDSQNAHFVEDYQLFTRSLVVVDGSNPKRFKNLDKVWDLVRDKAAFQKYVQDEVRAFAKS